jgi:hypothetical protein
MGTSRLIQAINGDNGGAGSSSYTLSFTNNVQAGSGIVACWAAGSSAPTSVKCNGSTVSLTAAINESFNGIYYLGSSAGGYKDVTVAFSGSNSVWFYLYEVPTILSINQSKDATATAAAWSSGAMTALTAPANCFVAAIVIQTLTVSGNTLTTPGLPWVEQTAYNVVEGQAVCSAYQIPNAGGSITYNGTNANGTSAFYDVCECAFNTIPSLPVAAPNEQDATGNIASIGQAIQTASVW